MKLPPLSIWTLKTNDRRRKSDFTCFKSRRNLSEVVESRQNARRKNVRRSQIALQRLQDIKNVRQQTSIDKAPRCIENCRHQNARRKKSGFTSFQKSSLKHDRRSTLQIDRRLVNCRLKYDFCVQKSGFTSFQSCQNQSKRFSKLVKSCRSSSKLVNNNRRSLLSPKLVKDRCSTLQVDRRQKDIVRTIVTSGQNKSIAHKGHHQTVPLTVLKFKMIVAPCCKWSSLPKTIVTLCFQAPSKLVFRVSSKLDEAGS